MASPQMMQLLAEQREAFVQGFASGFVELARLQCREVALAEAGRKRQAETSAADEQAGAGAAGEEASAFDNVKAKIQPQPEAECDSHHHAMEERDGTFHAVRGLAACRGWLQDDADTAAGGLGGSAAASSMWQLVEGRWLRDHLDVETSDAIDTMKVLAGSPCVAVQRAETPEEQGEAAVRTVAGMGAPDIPAVARAAGLPLPGVLSGTVSLESLEKAISPGKGDDDPDGSDRRGLGPTATGPSSARSGCDSTCIKQLDWATQAESPLGQPGQADEASEALQPMDYNIQWESTLDEQLAAATGEAGYVTSVSGTTATVCGGRRPSGASEQHVDVLTGERGGKWGGSDGGATAADGGGVGESQHQGSIGLGGASAEPLCDSQECAGSSSPRTPLVYEGNGRVRQAAGRWTLADDATDEQVTVCGGRRLIGATKQYADVLAGLSSGNRGGSDGGRTAADGGVGEEAQHQGSIGLGGASAEPLCDSGEFAGSLSPRASEFVVDGVRRVAHGGWTLAADASDEASATAAGSAADEATGEEVTVCGGRRPSGASEQYVDVLTGRGGGRGGGGDGDGGATAASAEQGGMTMLEKRVGGLPTLRTESGGGGAGRTTDVATLSGGRSQVLDLPAAYGRAAQSKNWQQALGVLCRLLTGECGGKGGGGDGDATAASDVCTEGEAPVWSEEDIHVIRGQVLSAHALASRGGRPSVQSRTVTAFLEHLAGLKGCPNRRNYKILLTEYRRINLD